MLLWIPPRLHLAIRPRGRAVGTRRAGRFGDQHRSGFGGQAVCDRRWTGYAGIKEHGPPVRGESGAVRFGSLLTGLSVDVCCGSPV